MYPHQFCKVGLREVAQTITKTITYDHAGRLEKVEQQISGDTTNGNVVLAQNDYNELGELMLKKLHSAGETSFAQDIDYLYDVRGWLNNINNLADASRRKLYAEQLNYFGNGNIQNMSWKNTLLDAQNAPTQTNRQKYDFTYDGLNRITAAVYTEINPSNLTVNAGNFSESYGYDPNGNFASLSRQGNKVLSGTTPVYGLIDNLTYNYGGNSNQLSSVADNVTGVTHELEFKPATGTYSYDNNGNASYVPQRSVTVAYNYLNLPSSVTVGSQGTISYLYDASGTKLKKTVGTVNSYYQGSVLKLNGTDIVMTGEGRAVKNGAWSYEYDLKDHLGNTRVSFSADNAAAQPLQYKDYYPFGLEMAKWYTTLGTPTKYLYNGKELQDEYGLGWYDYGARFYDPVIGRTPTLDPHAENHYSESPYSFLGNNPINSIDPDGMDWYTNRFSGDQKWYDDNKWRLMYSHNEGGSYTAHETTVTGISKETRKAAAESYEYEQNLNQQGIETYRTDSRLEAFANLVSLGALTEFKGLGNLFKSSKTAIAAEDLTKAAAKTETALATKYPANPAITGTTESTFLMPGQVIDRYGSLSGKWFSTPGTSYGARSIPPGFSPYTQFKVLKPFEVQKSLASPGFFNGQTGFGIQLQSPVGADILIKRKIISPF